MNSVTYTSTMLHLFSLQGVYLLHTATCAYASSSKARGAIGADKTLPWRGNSWSATSSEERSVPCCTDA
jgi:hypothetical protein